MALLQKALHLVLASVQVCFETWNKMVLSLNDFILSSSSRKRKGDFFHKAVLIGDGNARGFGERVLLGYPCGPARSMGYNLGKFPQVRHTWSFLGRGVIGSTSEDWRPEGEMFRKIFESRACVDTEVVVILVGVHDLLKARDQLSSEMEASKVESRIVTNLMDIAAELRYKGKKVCLCDLPTSLPLLKRYSESVKRVNTAIMEAAQRAPGGAIPVARMSSGRVSRGPVNVSWDGIHLSYEGYNSLGEEIMSHLSNCLVQVEWMVHQRYLSSRARDHHHHPHIVDDKTPPLTPTEHLKKTQ